MAKFWSNCAKSLKNPRKPTPIENPSLRCVWMFLWLQHCRCIPVGFWALVWYVDGADECFRSLWNQRFCRGLSWLRRDDLRLRGGATRGDSDIIKKFFWSWTLILAASSVSVYRSILEKFPKSNSSSSLNKSKAIAYIIETHSNGSVTTDEQPFHLISHTLFPSPLQELRHPHPPFLSQYFLPRFLSSFNLSTVA